MLAAFKDWLPLLTTIVTGLFAYRTVSRNARLQAVLQHRLKLMDRAHEAIDTVTVEAAAALHAQQRWYDARTKKKDGSGTRTESLEAYKGRFSLRRAASRLPPELYSDFDALSKAYDKLDVASFIADQATESEVREVGADLEAFSNVFSSWEGKVRAWHHGTWEANKFEIKTLG